ncbi:MAG: type III secretion system gatekeeper subunit SctW [Chlamydiales bacterium]
MPDSIQPINLAAIEQRATQKEARQAQIRQEAAKSMFIEEIEQGFNPDAVNREQSRLARFKRLETRKKEPHEKMERVNEVKKRSEEDLAQSYYQRNAELPPDRLRTLLKTLKHGQTPEEILDDVMEKFPDVTLADEALKYLEQETKNDLQSSVRLARELLNKLNEREIIAGRNIDTVAKSFHRKGIGNSPTELRELYRDITGNPRDHNTLFSELSNHYSFDQLKLVVAFLLKGLVYDLKSKGPSIQQAELMRLMTDTRNLQSILWVYFFFKSRMKLINSLYGAYEIHKDNLLNFEVLAQQFIKLVEERYPSVLKLLKQLEAFGSLEDLEKIIILMQYRDGIRQLSPRLYKSLRHRQNLLLIILEAIENLEEEIHEEED